MEQILIVARKYLDDYGVTARAHYLLAQQYDRLNRLIGIPSVVTSAIVGTTIFAVTKESSSELIRVVLGLYALIAAALTSLQTWLGFSEHAKNHRIAGCRYANLRRRLEIYCLRYEPYNDVGEIDEGIRPSALEELQHFTKELAELAAESPVVPDRFWNRAYRERHGNTSPLQRIWAGVTFYFLYSAYILALLALAAVPLGLVIQSSLGQETIGSQNEHLPGSMNQTAAGNSLASRATDAKLRTSSWFESIRNHPSLLRAFLFDFPKGGDLHLHLSGAIYAESYIKWATQQEFCVDTTSFKMTSPPCQAPSRPLRDALSDKDLNLYQRLIDGLSLRNFTPGRTTKHDQFFQAFGKFGDIAKIRQPDMLADVANRAANQNILYLEVMQTLQGDQVRSLTEKVPWTGDLDAFRQGLVNAGLTELVRSASEILTANESEMRKMLHCADAHPAPGCRVGLRYLQQTTRTAPPQQVFAQLVFAFELLQTDSRVVGLNLVAPEDDEVALRDYNLHMTMMDHLWRRTPSTNIALHAGELTLGLVPPDDLRNHIRLAIDLGHAKRVGHAVSLGFERSAYDLIEQLAKRGILIEINLTSNDAILGVAGSRHPFPDYLRAGAPMAISTDDEGVSRNDLTAEYQRAVETYGLQYDDLKWLSRNSIAYSFLPGDSLWTSTKPLAPVRACLGDEMGHDPPTNECHAFLQSSEKAQLQWQLEERFAAFENHVWPSF